MSKLKTLEDLMKPAHCENYACLIKAGDLKKEAIKHLKYLKKKSMPSSVKEMDRQFYADQQSCWNKMAWIIDFFNVAEEESEEPKDDINQLYLQNRDLDKRVEKLEKKKDE